MDTKLFQASLPVKHGCTSHMLQSCGHACARAECSPPVVPAGLSAQAPAQTCLSLSARPPLLAPPTPRVHRAARGRGANPIAHVLQAIDEPLDLIEYNRWNVIIPEGQFLTEARPCCRGKA